MESRVRRREWPSLSCPIFLDCRANGRAGRWLSIAEDCMRTLSLVGLLSLALSVPAGAADTLIPESLEKGTVRFAPRDDQSSIPARYRLDKHVFEFDLSQRLDLPNSDLDVHHLQFPSPVEPDTPQNNTVHG